MTRRDDRSDLWAVSCYFNPAGYRTKRANCLRFLGALERASVPYRLIECAFGSAPFELPEGPSTLRVRGLDVMWHKERLLNLAIAALPDSCSKVAWLDCDLLFEDPEWPRTTSDALEIAEVVQPFSEVIRLPRDPAAPAESGERARSFAAVQAGSPETLRSGDFEAHGHTGYAWAARRGWLERHGLYDVCVGGSADHLMAHALCGDTGSRCVDQIVGGWGPFRAHFEAWAEAVNRDVQGRLAAVPGRVLHLWHGEASDRHYDLRNRELRSFDFDPERDLALSDAGLWQWASVKPELHSWARAYYARRKEDGPPGDTSSGTAVPRPT